MMVKVLHLGELLPSDSKTKANSVDCIQEGVLYANEGENLYQS